jgi:hypothetical protein
MRQAQETAVLTSVVVQKWSSAAAEPPPNGGVVSTWTNLTRRMIETKMTLCVLLVPPSRKSSVVHSQETQGEDTHNCQFLPSGQPKYRYHRHR